MGRSAARARPRVLAGVLALAAACALAAPLAGLLPHALVHGLVVGNREWLLGNYLDPAGEAPSRVRNAGRKVLVTVLVHDLAAEVERRHPARPGAGDVERLLGVLLPLKEAFLNPHEVPHDPSDWPVMLSGLGYCDQVNGVAATVLARRFSRSETFNVWNEERQGHTIGRVWSDELGDWLYYDLFYDEVVVFRRSPEGGIRLMAREKPESAPAGRGGMRGEAYLRFLGHVGGGATMNEFHSTAGAYIAAKAATALTQGTLRSVAPSAAPPPPGLGTPSGPPLPAPAGAPDPDAVRRTREAYLEARLEHLAGSRKRAAALYREAAAAGLRSADPDARMLGEAASLFRARLAD